MLQKNLLPLVRSSKGKMRRRSNSPEGQAGGLCLRRHKSSLFPGWPRPRPQQEAVLGENIWPRNKIQLAFKSFNSDPEIHKQCKMEIQDGVLRLSLAAAAPPE